MRGIRGWFAVGALGAVFLLAASANAAPPSIPLPDCPTTTTAGALTPGQHATGYTVRRGETVETFDVEIEGIATGGNGPGHDVVIIRASGPVIDEGGGGISAGMSGSPVYTDDGDLIGAVAFGFSQGPSPVGGVTLADPDMTELLDEPAYAKRSGNRIALKGRKLRKRLRRAGVSKATLDGGLRRLSLPVSVSGGLSAQHLAPLRKSLRKAGVASILTAGAAKYAPLGPGSLITPTATLAGGDSIGANLSFGDVTAGAIGTTTYVCDDRTLAFGHPFNNSGPTLLGATRGYVFSVVDDDVLGPFKFASPTDPVGVVDLDRPTGIRTQVGDDIPAYPVVSDSHALDTGRERLGAETDIVRAPGPLELMQPSLMAEHLLANVDSAFGQTGPGSLKLSWTIHGEKKSSGAPFTITRTNRFASDFDISLESVFELVQYASTVLAQNVVKPLRIDSVDLDASVRQTERRFKIRRVRWARNRGPLRNVSSLRVRPGDRIRARAELAATDSNATRTVNMWFGVPNRRRGKIQIAGGADIAEDAGFDVLCVDAEFCGELDVPHSLSGLLAALNGIPRNDELITTADFGGAPHIGRRLESRVVNGGDSLRVRVAKP